MSPCLDYCRCLIEKQGHRRNPMNFNEIQSMNDVLAFFSTLFRLTMTPEPPDDDKCQISMCRQTHFTYCPHCKLFVCIEHLNEHYATYRQEYQSLIHEGKQQHSCNRELLNQIENEKRYFHEFFHREIQYYEAHEKYIHEKSNQTLIRPQDCADLRSHILQSTQKRTKLKQMLQQFRQIIENYTAELPDVSTVDGNSVRRVSSSSLSFSLDPPNLLAKVKKEEPVHPPKSMFSIEFTETAHHSMPLILL